MEYAAKMRRDGTEYVEMIVLLLILCWVKLAGVSCVWEGYGECCLGLASGSGEEIVAGTQIETQNIMEEDWICTEPGTQMKLKGLTVHSVQ